MNANLPDYYTEEDTKEDVYENKKNDLHFKSCVQSFLRNKHLIADLEKEQSFLRDQLIFMADGKNCSGSGILLEKYEAKGQVDYSIVPELLGVDLELYRKPKQTRWRITEI